MGLDAISSEVRQQVAATLRQTAQRLKTERQALENDMRFDKMVELMADQEFAYRLLVEHLVGPAVIPLRPESRSRSGD